MADEKENWIPKTIIGEKEKLEGGTTLKPMQPQENESARPISLTHSTIRKYKDGQSIKIAAMLAGQVDPLGRLKTDAEVNTAQIPEQRQRDIAQTKTMHVLFARGDEVVDVERNRKAVVLKTGVAFTNKGTPIHRVGSMKTGEKWLVSEKKLRKK